MKKVILTVILMFLLPMAASAGTTPDTYNLYLDATLDSGATTVASGTSTMVLQGNGKTRSVGTTSIHVDGIGPYWSLQMSGVSESIAQKASGGNLDDMEYDVYAEWTLDTSAWTNAKRFYFAKDMKLSGNSMYVITRELPSTGDIRFQFVTSATTPFDYAHFKLKGGTDAGYKSRPIELDYDVTAFSTGGTTQFWSGTTAIPLVNGANRVEVQPNGDDGWFTTDGTTEPTDGGSTFMEANKVWALTPWEWEHFWFLPDGDANGYLNIRQISDCD